MIKNVYQHGRKHGGEYYLQEFLSILAQTLETDNFLAHIKDLNICKFILKLNKFNEKICKLPFGKIQFLKECDNFISENFYLYKNCADFDVFYLIRAIVTLDLNHDVVLLAKRLYARVLPVVWQIKAKKINAAKEIVINWKNKNKKYSTWQVKFLNLPHVSYAKRKDPILVLDSNGAVENLNVHSVIVEAISDISEHACFILIDLPIAQDSNIIKLYNELARKKVLI